MPALSVPGVRVTLNDEDGNDDAVAQPHVPGLPVLALAALEAPPRKRRKRFVF